MQNREEEIAKSGIFSRRGYGGKRKARTSIDEQGLFRKMNRNKKRIDERWQTWQEYATKLKANLEEVHRRMCVAVFDEMISYLKETNELLDVERDIERVQLLPVACLNTGINLPDHDTTFSLLSHRIKDSQVTPHIIRLSALNATTVKHAFCAIADQLGMGDRSDVSIWNIEKFIALTEFAELTRPIVIIFEDSEAFNPSVFSQLLEMFSAAQSSLKIIIILGIATDSSMINDVLPYEALSLLDMKHFACLSAPKYLQEFLNIQLMTPRADFQLSSHSFEFLLIQFLNYDFSVSNFAAGVLFAAMEHYREQPLSFLCTDKATGLDRIKSMGEDELKDLNQLPSMKDNDSASDRRHLMELYENHFEEEEIVHMFLRAFNTSQRHLIEHPFGKRPRTNYILSLENKLVDTGEYRKYITYLSLLDDDKFAAVVADYKRAFDIKPEFRFTQYLEEVTCRLMTDDLSELVDTGENNGEDKDDDTKKAKNAYELQKQLRSKASSRSRPKTKYQHLRAQFCDFLTTVCQDYFYAGRMKKPLAELFHYSNRKKLKDMFNPSLTRTLQRAMTAPAHYLNDEKMKVEGDSIHADLPDISIAYKLFTQSGNMINLADWMDSFMAIKEDDEKKTKSIELEARFMQCANDLQFIGLLKPTQRKTDHVQKCTWAL